MFLAHFSGTPLSYWLEQPIEDCTYWFVEAQKLHKKMNEVKES